MKSERLDKLVADGNSSLLVLRNKSTENELSLFNALTSIS